MNRPLDEVRAFVRKILNRIECDPWSLSWYRQDGRDYLFATHMRDIQEDTYVAPFRPKGFEIRSLQAQDIIVAAWDAILDGERTRALERFTYRGRDIFNPRFFKGGDPLHPSASLPAIVEEIDRIEALGTFDTRTFSVTTAGVATLEESGL